MTIAIIGMLDERQEALQLLKERIEAKNHRTLLIDISIGTGAAKSGLVADISCEGIALAGGTTLDRVKGMLAMNREKATSLMAEGLHKRLLERFVERELRGVVAVGGMTGTLISLTAMKGLPFGFPKLMISSVAAVPVHAHMFAEYFGMSDITVMHTVVDTVGMNPHVRKLMNNGAGAICGMVEGLMSAENDERPTLALTEFGHCEKGAHYIREFLEGDNDIISFHATGLGERAVGDMVSQGLFRAFIDLVPAGFSEYLLGGTRATGPDRLDAGCKFGGPYILAPCGFDMIGCGPIERRDNGDPLWVSRRLAERKIFIQDAVRVQARTAPDEMRIIAREVAKKLNGHPNKRLVKFVIPTRGFSSLSAEGDALYDPASDQVFIDQLKDSLDPEIEIIEVNAHINTQQFARAVAEALGKTFRWVLPESQGSSPPNSFPA